MKFKYFSSKKRKRTLILWNQYMTYLFYVLYPLLLVFVLLFHHEDFLKVIGIPSISFIVLTIVRKMINAPRPYENGWLIPIISKNTKGNSMPSRHIFSATCISILWFYYNPMFGMILLLISVINAIVRVLGGVHYPKDVVVGYLVGVACGFLMYLY